MYYFAALPLSDIRQSVDIRLHSLHRITFIYIFISNSGDSKGGSGEGTPFKEGHETKRK